MLQKFRINQKLIAGFLVIAVIGGIIGAIGVVNVNRISGTNKFLFEKSTMPAEYLGTIAASFHRQRINLLQGLRATDPEKIHYYCG